MPMPPSVSHARPVDTSATPDAAGDVLSPPGFDLVLAVVASTTAVGTDALKGPWRGAPRVAGARQLAIYLGRVTLGCEAAAIVASLGRRRSTIRWACGAVEERRDDASFDLALTMIERGCIRLLQAA